MMGDNGDGILDEESLAPGSGGGAEDVERVMGEGGLALGARRVEGAGGEISVLGVGVGVRLNGVGPVFERELGAFGAVPSIVYQCAEALKMAANGVLHDGSIPERAKVDIFDAILSDDALKGVAKEVRYAALAAIRTYVANIAGEITARVARERAVVGLGGAGIGGGFPSGC